VDEILNKVAFVVRFMALFSILTGLLVLISSVLLSKYQRIRESVLLRTIGAKRRQILWINGLEYFILGSLATITGLFLAVLGAWTLAYFQLDIPFRPNLWPALYSYLIITGLTVVIGLFNSREIVNEPPLEVLRRIG
jgi:putative ABC transport system permease protein